MFFIEPGGHRISNKKTASRHARNGDWTKGKCPYPIGSSKAKPCGASFAPHIGIIIEFALPNNIGKGLLFK